MKLCAICGDIIAKGKEITIKLKENYKGTMTYNFCSSECQNNLRCNNCSSSIKKNIWTASRAWNNEESFLLFCSEKCRNSSKFP